MRSNFVVPFDLPAFADSAGFFAERVCFGVVVSFALFVEAFGVAGLAVCFFGAGLVVGFFGVAAFAEFFAPFGSLFEALGLLPLEGDLAAAFVDAFVGVLGEAFLAVLVGVFGAAVSFFVGVLVGVFACAVPGLCAVLVCFFGVVVFFGVDFSFRRSDVREGVVGVAGVVSAVVPDLRARTTAALRLFREASCVDERNLRWLLAAASDVAADLTVLPCSPLAFLSFRF